MARKIFSLNLNDFEAIGEMEDKEVANLFRAIIHYVKGEEFILDDAVKYVFASVRKKLDKDIRGYEKNVMMNKLNGSKRSRKKLGQAAEKSGTKPQTRTKQTIPDSSDNPVKEEVKAELIVPNSPDSNIIKVEFTKQYFKKHWQELLAKAKELFADKEGYIGKDFDKTMEEFLEGIEIKNYGYKNYWLAYLKWVRMSKPVKYNNKRGGIDLL